MVAGLRIQTCLLLALLFFSSCGARTGRKIAPPSAPPSVSVNLQRAALGIRKLQAWYNTKTGLWRTTSWWNAANAITVLAEYSRLSGSPRYLSAISNTYTRNRKSGFLNEYYDDEGWWALAWIESYDATGNPAYLSMANGIFTDMARGWDTGTCGGGLWWNKKRKYKNAIPNELFLSVAANLALRARGTKERALDLQWAQAEWQWFSQSGMINAQNLINDGLNSSCKNNHGRVWSYNQGVILGGLTALSKLTNNPSLLDEAQKIALAAIAHLTDSHGILHDPCEPDHCGGDAPQFKGIFVRNLAILNSARPQVRYTTFLRTNSSSIWTNDRGRGNQFGLVWSGPFRPPTAAAAAIQVSAIDCFLATCEVQAGTK